MFLSDEWRFSKTRFELLSLTVLEAGACAHQNFEKYSFRKQSDNQALMTAIKERRPYTAPEPLFRATNLALAYRIKKLLIRKNRCLSV